eukprot:TRINITY_DN5469_c0_g1_i1.p1 TRINITY_DN5469_c0_g1~~TRINITY_DN5469_c0_g1_i1.p1  ORF type:complete len:672 (+),score=134.49 TRINITY_DN5469_c0_g1_i1:103-2118(+)
MAEIAPVFDKIELTEAECYACGLVLATCLAQHKRWDMAWRKALLAGLLERYQLSNSKQTMEAVVSGEADLDVGHLLKVLFERNDTCTLDFLSNVLKSGLYDARARVLLKRFAVLLDMAREDLRKLEGTVANQLAEYKSEHEEEIRKEVEERAKSQRRNKWMKIGLAGVVGGVAIGVTGGLAAPLVAAGVGTAFGASAAVALGTTAGIYAIGTLFAVGGVSLTGYHMSRRVGKLEEFYFARLSSQEQLSVTVCVSGWAIDDDVMNDYVLPWTNLDGSSDTFCLVWEREAVHTLTRALSKMLKDEAVSFAITETLKHTVLLGIISAIAWPAAILKVASLLDNSWSIAVNRADLAGHELANALLLRAQGGRPVTLIGYSLGARVIFACLKELASRKQAQGIVEDVVLMGLPMSGAPDVWQGIRNVVHGRVTVLHSTQDWLLRFLFRGTSAELFVAGIEGVQGVDFVDNVDVTNIVGTKHSSYHRDFARLLELTPAKGQQKGRPSVGDIGARVRVVAQGPGVLHGIVPATADSVAKCQVSLDTPKATNSPVDFICRSDHGVTVPAADVWIDPVDDKPAPGCYSPTHCKAGWGSLRCYSSVCAARSMQRARYWVDLDKLREDLEAQDEDDEQAEPDASGDGKDAEVEERDRKSSMFSRFMGTSSSSQGTAKGTKKN